MIGESLMHVKREDFETLAGSAKDISDKVFHSKEFDFSEKYMIIDAILRSSEEEAKGYLEKLLDFLLFQKKDKDSRWE